MFGSTDHLERLFANRFEPDAGGYLFRAKYTAPAIVVSGPERDRFVTDFRRRIRRASWGLGGSCVLLMVGAAFASSAASIKLPDFAIYVLLTPCLCTFLGLTYWLWDAPVRALRSRPASAEGRSKAEARRAALLRMTWGQLGAAAAMPAVLLVSVGSRRNLLEGWNRLWLVSAALVLTLVAFRALKKWRASVR